MLARKEGLKGSRVRWARKG